MKMTVWGRVLSFVSLLAACGSDPGEPSDVGPGSEDGRRDAGSADQGMVGALVEVASVEPREGGVGEPVTIRGRGLSGAVVRFGPAVAVAVSDADEAIVRTIPALGPGVVPISVEDVDAGTFEILPPPSVTEVVPRSGIPGDEVTIRGQQLEGVDVSFGGTLSEVVSDAPTEIVRAVPRLGPGIVNLAVDDADAGAFEILSFVVEQIAPEAGVIGSEITLQGRGLSDQEARLGDRVMATVRNTGTELVVRVPDTSLGTYALALGDVEVGSFEVLGPRLTRICPSSNPTGGPLQIRGERLDLLTSLEIGSYSVPVESLEPAADGSIILEVPHLPIGPAPIRATGPWGAPPEREFDVIPDFPSGLPRSPNRIVLPRALLSGYIPPVGRFWRNAFDSSHTLALGGDRPCEPVLDSGSVGGEEGLGGSLYRVTGTYDKAANTMVLSIDRDGAVETYRGEWMDTGFTGLGTYHELLLTSDSDCRQVLVEVDTTGLCDDP